MLILPGGFKKDIAEQAELIIYDKYDGVEKLGHTGEGSLLDSKNRFWLGSAGGLVFLDLNTFKQSSKIPKKVRISHTKGLLERPI